MLTRFYNTLKNLHSINLFKIVRVDAVIRNFEIIGEAGNRLSETFKAKYPGIDWQRIRGFRNRIVHDYFGIDYSIVWQIKESYLPNLITELRQIQFD